MPVLARPGNCGTCSTGEARKTSNSLKNTCAKMDNARPRGPSSSPLASDPTKNSAQDKHSLLYLYYVHCSLWLSSSVHILPCSPLFFGCTQSPDSSYRTFHSQHKINSLCYKIICITCTALYDYLTPLPSLIKKKIVPSFVLQLYTSSRALRSSSDSLSLQIPRTRLSAVGSRAFFVFSPS